MKHIKLFEHFKEKEENMREGQEVAVLDMRTEAKSRVDEVINAFNVASSELYELKKMSDDIKMEFPDLSKDILNTVEPLMEKIERDYPEQLKELLKKFR